jgi:hypothetical protein
MLSAEERLVVDDHIEVRLRQASRVSSTRPGALDITSGVLQPSPLQRQSDKVLHAEISVLTTMSSHAREDLDEGQRAEQRLQLSVHRCRATKATVAHARQRTEAFNATLRGMLRSYEQHNIQHAAHTSPSGPTSPNAAGGRSAREILLQQRNAQMRMTNASNLGMSADGADVQPPGTSAAALGAHTIGESFFGPPELPSALLGATQDQQQQGPETLRPHEALLLRMEGLRVQEQLEHAALRLDDVSPVALYPTLLDLTGRASVSHRRIEREREVMHDAEGELAEALRAIDAARADAARAQEEAQRLREALDSVHRNAFLARRDLLMTHRRLTGQDKLRSGAVVDPETAATALEVVRRELTRSAAAVQAWKERSEAQAKDAAALQLHLSGPSATAASSGPGAPPPRAYLNEVDASRSGSLAAGGALADGGNGAMLAVRYWNSLVSNDAAAEPSRTLRRLIETECAELMPPLRLGGGLVAGSSSRAADIGQTRWGAYS